MKFASLKKALNVHFVTKHFKKVVRMYDLWGRIWKIWHMRPTQFPFFCYCFLSKWGNFLATIFEFVYILASLDLNHHIPIIQNFPHKICIRTKFWTFPTKDNSCPSMHSSIQQIQHWPPFPYCALIVISFTTKFRSWDFGTAPELLTCPLLSFSVQLLATYVCYVLWPIDVGEIEFVIKSWIGTWFWLLASLLTSYLDLLE